MTKDFDILDTFEEMTQLAGQPNNFNAFDIRGASDEVVNQTIHSRERELYRDVIVEQVYNEWMTNIVKDLKTSKNGKEDIINHLHKHVEELRTRGPSTHWFASMISLIIITRDIYNMKNPTTLDMLNRLYRHWYNDMSANTPPPVTYDLLEPDQKIYIEKDKIK